MCFLQNVGRQVRSLYKKKTTVALIYSIPMKMSHSVEYKGPGVDLKKKYVRLRMIISHEQFVILTINLCRKFCFVKPTPGGYRFMFHLQTHSIMGGT